MDALVDPAAHELPQRIQSDHYNFENYVHRARWSSYWHQVRETLAERPATVLVVGAGDGIVPAILRSQGLTVHTLDCQTKLNPTFLGDVREIDEILVSKEFDVVVCCQVLEHLPFEYFEDTIRRLVRCARKRVVISLPYCTRNLCTVLFSLPRVRLPKLSLRLPLFWRRWTFNGEHHWEVGTRGCSMGRVTEIISRHATTFQRFVATDNEYHLFFVLTTGQDEQQLPMRSSAA